MKQTKNSSFWGSTFFSVFLLHSLASAAHGSEDGFILGGISLTQQIEESASEAMSRGYTCALPLTTKGTEKPSAAVCARPPEELPQGLDTYAKDLDVALYDIMVKVTTGSGKVSSASELDSIFLGARFLSKFFEDLKLLITYEVSGVRRAIFSCAYFSACGRRQEEIHQEISKLSDPDSSVVIAMRPMLIEEIVDALLASNEYSKGALDAQRAAISYASQFISFSTEISKCALKGYERVCVYEGALQVKLPAEYVSEDLILQHPKAAQLVTFGVRIEGMDFILVDELPELSDRMNFE